VEKQMIEHKKEHETFSNLNGFYLVKGLFVIHLLEGDSKVLNDFIAELYREFKKEKTIYSIINIIAFNEENPHPMFDKWYSESVF